MHGNTVPATVITGPKYKPVGLLYGKDHLMIKVVGRMVGDGLFKFAAV